MTSRIASSRCLTVALLASVLLSPGLAVTSTSADVGSTSVRARGQQEADRDRDILVATRGDERGLHVFTAMAPAWEWHSLATIRSGPLRDWPWTGYHCVTGDGKFVVVVAAPMWFVNQPDLRDREAFAFGIEIATGSVKPLVSGVALKYYNPGCGVDGQAALIRHVERDQRRTEVLVFDLEKAELSRRFAVAGQLTSAVPMGEGVAGARDKAVVRLDSGGEHIVAATPGLPFSLRPSARGVDFLVARPTDRVEVWRADRDHVNVVASGDLGELALHGGRAGRNILVGDVGRKPGLTVVPSHEGGVLPRFVSHSGRATMADPAKEADGSAGDRLVKVVGKGAFVRPFPSPTARVTTTSPPGVDEAGESLTGGEAGVSVLGLVAPEQHTLGNHSPGGPGCAIPRNDVRRQVPQPNAAQVDWAVQQATRNLLKGSVLTRPADYANTGVPSYQPSNDFARGTLQGDTSAPVPPSVIQATYAQESAWRQASWRALPGVAGNPLVADFYGANGTLDQIDYGESDCGYGLSQVTEPMRADSHTYSLNGKIKVAIDYAENVAAGIQFLVSKWNQLHNAGILANGGDPNLLENWYMALWAYNSGVQPEGAGCTPGPSCTDANGNWGLGWTNNPIQADYPPDRSPFLRTTYADAEHPSDWPYQERVLGWMETPLIDYKGDRSYARPDYVPGDFSTIDIPHRTTFCNASNDCDTEHQDGNLSFCTRADRHCWWHESVDWTSCPSACAVSRFTVAPTAGEPVGDDNYAPNCDVHPGPSSVGPAILVDNQPSNINVEGCGGSTWTSEGSFSMEFGKDSNGAELGQIDFHQLGTGFGGHTWFTKNRQQNDQAHVNVGTWTPDPAFVGGTYLIKAHVPPSGASTSSAHYVVHLGDGTVEERTVDQHLHENRWVSVGRFQLHPGARVVLTNVTDEPNGGMANVAFDALAFIPISGSLESVTVDAVQIFDPDQNIDTVGSFMLDTPFESEAKLVSWASKLIDGGDSMPGVLEHPPCFGLTHDQCVGVETWRAFEAWGRQVRGLPPAVEPQRPAVWMHFANDRPPSELDSSYLDDLGRFKQHTSLTVDYEVANGAVDISTVSVSERHRAGATSLPPFLLDFMRALAIDYGIAVPDMTYSVQNLTVYTHRNSSAKPHLDGILPGRAFRSHSTSAEKSGDCMAIEAVSGSIIGWKPMLNEGGIEGEIEIWKGDVEDLADSGVLPQAVARAADEFFKVLFSSQWQWNAQYVGSPFRWAPPIWLELSLRVCADGTVRSLGQQIGDGSLMPDLYLYRNGIAIDQQGAATAGEPVLQGDFLNFSRDVFTDPNPWGPCDFAGDRREGNPWTIGILERTSTGDEVRLCSGTSESQHDPQ